MTERTQRESSAYSQVSFLTWKPKKPRRGFFGFQSVLSLSKEEMHMSKPEQVRLALSITVAIVAVIVVLIAANGGEPRSSMQAGPHSLQLLLGMCGGVEQAVWCTYHLGVGAISASQR